MMGAKAITALAFDFGTRRIGLAVGNSITGSSQALAPITADQDDARFALIATQVKEWAPDQLVVGLPCHPDGAEHEMTLKAKRFGNQLHGRFQKDVVWVDERYTSVSVQDGNDALAAQLILQQYLDTL